MNTLITLTGPSGTGKSTLEKKLIEQHGFAKIISVTTRPPRPGEVDGVDYHFITPEHMAWLVESGELIEHITFSGNNSQYGVTVDEVERAFAQGKPVVLVVEPEGARQIRNYCRHRPDWHHVAFYLDNDIQTLLERLLERFRTDTAMTAKAASQRITYMLESELTWVRSPLWDIIVSSTGPETEFKIISTIKAHVGVDRLKKEDRLRRGVAATY